MTLRILYVIENVFFGGGERAFAQIINGLDKEKYEIYVACFPEGIFEEKIGTSAKILPFDLRNRFNLVNIYKLANIIRENNIQIVHSQGGRGGFFARIAARIAKVAGVISTIAAPVEGFDVGLVKKMIYIALERFSERFVDRFIVVSEALRDRLIRKHKIPERKVIKIYNGIEVEKYYSNPKSACKVRDEFNIKPDVQLVGTIGRLVRGKGLPYFIQAIKQTVDGKWQMAGETRFLIVGEGSERESLEHTVRELGIEKNVIFTGFRKDVKEILEALHVLVLPSIREGQPIVLLEAMAMGKPIVATNIEGVNETVANGVSGILVPPKDSSALAEAIVCLLKDSKKAQIMGQVGRKLAEEKFNLKDKIEQHERLYETIHRQIRRMIN